MYIIFHSVISDGQIQTSSELLDDIDDLNSVIGSMQSIAKAKGFSSYIADVYFAKDCVMHTDLATGRVWYTANPDANPHATYSRELR